MNRELAFPRGPACQHQAGDVRTGSEQHEEDCAEQNPERQLQSSAGEVRKQGSAPSVNYRFIDGSGGIGVIASVTEPFCSFCTRARLTADGKLVTCLFPDHGHDLKMLIRTGATDEEIIGSMSAIWRRRVDRLSDERLEAMNSPQGYQAKAHQKIEMITLGG